MRQRGAFLARHRRRGAFASRAIVICVGVGRPRAPSSAWDRLREPTSARCRCPAPSSAWHRCPALSPASGPMSCAIFSAAPPPCAVASTEPRRAIFSARTSLPGIVSVGPSSELPGGGPVVPHHLQRGACCPAPGRRAAAPRQRQRGPSRRPRWGACDARWTGRRRWTTTTPPTPWRTGWSRGRRRARAPSSRDLPGSAPLSASGRVDDAPGPSLATAGACSRRRRRRRGAETTEGLAPGCRLDLRQGASGCSEPKGASSRARSATVWTRTSGSFSRQRRMMSSSRAGSSIRCTAAAWAPAWRWRRRAPRSATLEGNRAVEGAGRDDAERPDVGARVDVLRAPHLLGRLQQGQSIISDAVSLPSSSAPADLRGRNRAP